jgi:hypothetical protein
MDLVTQLARLRHLLFSFFGLAEVIFVGYTVSAEGTRPLEEAAGAIADFQQPATFSEL